MIFIQIASYRDPQLVPTIMSIIDNASNPNDLTFGICWQHDNEEYIEDFLWRDNFSIISIPYEKSKGCCWARSMVNKLYNGEDYVLQLDSHHRFEKNWDTSMIDMLNSLPYKSYLTAYCPSYNPETEERVYNAWVMDVDTSLPMDIPCFRPGYSDSKEPVPTNLFSGHFFFAKGQAIIDVPYDEDLYFHGEEITIAARLFTHGYNGYHPHIPLVWHEYTRNGRTKQWDDDKEWWMKDVKSKEKVKKVLSGQIPELLGSERDINEFISKYNIQL
jgi:hypothetical protein